MSNALIAESVAAVMVISVGLGERGSSAKGGDSGRSGQEQGCNSLTGARNKSG